MNKGREMSNKRFFGCLAVLVGLITLPIISSRTKIQAEKIGNLSENLSENKNESNQPDDERMPLLFEPNKGQTGKAAKFVSRGNGYTLYLSETEAAFQLQTADDKSNNDLENPKTKGQLSKTDSAVLKMKFVGANTNPKIEGVDEAVTKTNYDIEKKQIENLSNYREVDYKDLYNGIDVVFYGNTANRLEYDFKIAPNADPNQIQLNFDGAKNISIDEQGNLVIKTGNIELVQQKPVAYQIFSGVKRLVEVKYVINEEQQTGNSQSQVSFAVGEYYKNQPLIIDPALSYFISTGSLDLDKIHNIAVDITGKMQVR